MGKIRDLKADEFDSLISELKIPALIDFHAAWCGPCKALAPTLDALSREYEGEIEIVKVDVDAEPDLKTRFDVRALPTLILLQNGETKERLMGGITRGRIATMLDQYVGGAA